LNCGCRKKSKHCGPGCLCQGCTNVEHNNIPDEKSGSSSSSDESDSGTPSNEDSEDLEEEVITDDNFYFSSYDIM